MTQDRVMLLIDADNVSVDVIEQSVARLLDEHGALHVRRAYGTAESVVKCQAVFKRLSIRPMVNLSSGKNSTDIALAVDAMDLVLAERPDIVVIASSDSDFAPLVGRLREKGCRVLGIGQDGKTGDETQKVYDGFTVLAHRRNGLESAGTAAKPANAPAPARQRPPAARKAVTKTAVAAAPAPAAKTVARAAVKTAAKTAARKTATPRTKAAPAAVEAAPKAPTGGATEPAAEKLRQIFAELPELLRGDKVELRLAASRLRDAGLLSRNGTCTKLFGHFGDRFELTPARNPNHVRLRDAAEATAV